MVSVAFSAHGRVPHALCAPAELSCRKARADLMLSDFPAVTECLLLRYKDQKIHIGAGRWGRGAPERGTEAPYPLGLQRRVSSWRLLRKASSVVKGGRNMRAAPFPATLSS